MKKILLLSIVLIASVFILNSCKKEEDPIFGKKPGPDLDLDLFEQNIIDYVNFGGNSPIGWGYVITKNGKLEKSGSFGDARIEGDGQIPFTINKKINIASITKFYTAMAAMKLIYANGLTLDSAVSPWLPGTWVRGPRFNTSDTDRITFRDLLTHRSGLVSVNSFFDSTLSYIGIQGCIANGSTQAKTRNYLNVNYALFRILIPSLWNALPESPNNIDIESDMDTRMHFQNYMQQNIFDVAGLSNITFEPEARTIETLYYNLGDSAASAGVGIRYGSWANKSGGGGYFMTLREMGAVNAYFENTELILSKELKQIMRDARIGSRLASSLETRGRYYGHGGSISDGNGRGVNGFVASFPSKKVEIAIIMNTQGVTVNESPNNANVGNMVYRAYNDAWK